MSDAFGQQREVRSRVRSSRPKAAPNLVPGADDHLDEETSAAFALGALDGPERDLVEFHIRFCRRCAATVERDLRTTGMLPYLATPAVPPPDVKAALFARIGHTQRAMLAAAPVDVAPSARQLPTLPASTLLPPIASPTSQTGGVPAASGRSFGWIGSVLSVPLLLALVATGFWGVQLRDQLDAQGSRMSSLEAQLANFGSGTTFQMSPGLAVPQAEGRLLLGANEQAGILEVDLNSDAAAGEYEVWGWDGNGNYGPITDLKVGTDGTGKAQFSLDQPFSAYESVQIVSKGLDGEAQEDDVVLQLGNAQLGSTGSALAPMP